MRELTIIAIAGRRVRGGEAGSLHDDTRGIR
jgi:hypothetical protein